MHILLSKKQATYYTEIIGLEERRGWNHVARWNDSKEDKHKNNNNINKQVWCNFISSCLQGLSSRWSFTFLCSLSSSISTLTTLSLSLCCFYVWLILLLAVYWLPPFQLFFFVLFFFSYKSKIQCLLLLPRSVPVLILFVFVSVCIIWLCFSLESVLLCCLQLCYCWPAVTDSAFSCSVLLYFVFFVCSLALAIDANCNFIPAHPLLHNMRPLPSFADLNQPEFDSCIPVIGLR